MNSTHDERTKKTLIWMIGANVAVWVLQNIVSISGGGASLSNWFAYSNENFLGGQVWTPFTHAFLHAYPGVSHLLFNMLGLFLVGRHVVGTLGVTRFLQFYAIAAVSGAALFAATSAVTGSAATVIGASGAVFGILAFFVLLAPDDEMLFFFVLPMKRKVFGLIMLAIAIAGFLFGELARSDFAPQYAHSAHLGGMLGGYLYFKLIYLPNPFPSTDGFEFKLPSFLQKKTSPETRTENYRYSVNISRPQEMKIEVDRILDKINSKGFGALTATEKKTLDEARELLRKR